ncbi:MAG: 2-phosphosulfolactate phosphatase [Planctomycetaceae bacterium]
MTQAVSVHMLPQFVEPQSLRGGVAVMIDILRASTTVVHALAREAAAIVPCETVEEAWKLKTSLEDQTRTSPGGRSVLLGGERQGERIDRFDLGNSPLAYTTDVVAGKTIVFTTTNGTRALGTCRAADRVLVGAFVNRTALVRVLKQDGRPVHLVCAGTDGGLTAEDILFAGAVASDLTGMRAVPAGDEIPTPLDIQTQMAIDYFRARSTNEATLRETIRFSRGGQNLLRLGMDADIDRAAQSDLFDIVPEWRPDQNRIVPARRT